MGQANLRRAERAAANAQVAAQLAVFTRIADALRRLSVAASANLGQDCYTHAALAQALLADHGIAADLVIGYAAWRVGNGDGDVISHRPSAQQTAQPGARPFHAWLQVGDWVYDPSTYQLPRKALALDALDGGHTTVAWCPDHLLLRRDGLSRLTEVAQGHQGLCYYERVPALESALKAQAGPLDPEDLALARLLFRHPHLAAVGPNQWADETARG